MTTHLTSRLAWHDSGWNGRICEQPDCNTYCVGRHSYPGDVIARERDLESEKANANKAVADLKGDELPPCIYSINAFSPGAIRGYSNPPHFFRGGADRTEWDIPEATVCLWPYEEVYGEDIKDESGRVDNDKRAVKVEEYFSEIEPGKSLIFYYVNYSNPFSEEESQKYVLVGASRIKSIGERLVYDNPNDWVRGKFAGGMIWARNVSSYYPDQGLRIPYHNYRNNPEVLQQIAVFPENPWHCKYGTRRMSNDDAIGMLEQLLNAVHTLKEIGDESEDWDARINWLQGCINELWKKRGLYPGLLNIADFLFANNAVMPIRDLMEAGKSQEAHRLFFESLNEQKCNSEIGIAEGDVSKISRQWNLKSEEARELLQSVLPRFDLTIEQISRIVSDEKPERRQFNLPEDISAIAKNPYLLCEQYIGNNPDDRIPWGVIDRGVLPSPEMGGSNLSDMEFDDPRRMRALCVEHLRREPNQTFRASDQIIAEINTRLEKLPEWKQARFTMRYLEVDREILAESLVLKSEKDRLWMYLKEVHENERDVEKALVEISRRLDIDLARPFAEEDWCHEIQEDNSPLYNKAQVEYVEIVKQQAKSCASIFRKPLSIVTGAAGTGKTSVICAIINAIRKTEGDGAIISVLAPTGKASDRIRAKTTERGIQISDISTVHSFLARGNWLNNNLTFKRKGGKPQGGGTIIIDEASMLALDLMACLMRAIDFRQVKRFILVGDPYQLPPIGRGRVFADTIEWLTSNKRENIAVLENNLRQLENTVEEKGTAILSLANMFIAKQSESEERATSLDDENLLQRIHKEGKVDADLDVVFWQEPESLSEKLIGIIEKEMTSHTGKDIDLGKPYDLWRAAFDRQPERYQILTPHRGELHGVDAVNEVVQGRISAGLLKSRGAIDGITLGDKVIQYRNRPASNPIWAYNFNTGKPERIPVFNGEIGFVWPHNFDKGKKGKIARFQVKFQGKGNYAVAYGQNLAKQGAKEKVEDNLELAYAISIHKAQGSEFDHTYVIIPETKGRPLSSELIYTALTRASKHCTLLVQGDVSTLLSARRLENSQSNLVSSSLFEGIFRDVPDELINRKGWYEEGLIHETLSNDMVRSKSEVIIANILHERNIPFHYEMLLKAPDGTAYLPDFTIVWQGEKWYWEHWGMMSSEEYRVRRDQKIGWYNEHFPGRLIETFEDTDLSIKAEEIIKSNFS